MILVTGSLAFDYIMDYKGKFGDHIMPDKIHQLNLSFLVSNLKKQPGGTAGNIAYNLALLKTPVSILASAGNDFAPYQKFLDTSGVETQNIKIIPNLVTASAFIMTDLSDNQITAFDPGAMTEAKTLSLKDLPQKPDFVVIAPNDPEAMVNLARESKELNIPYMADPGMQLPAFNKEQILEIITGAEILIANDYEMDLLKEKTSLDDSRLLQQAKLIITTLGEKGSIIQDKNQKLTVSSAKLQKVIDPTGAGDAFRSGFLSGYLKKLDLKTCAQMGSVTACYTIEKYGTTAHTFSLKEFKKRYLDNYNEILNF